MAKEEIKFVQDGEVVNTVDVTPEATLSEDEKGSFGAKDCGVVLGIAIAGIAAYEGIKHGVKAVKEHTIPWVRSKFGKNKTETQAAPAQELKEKSDEAAAVATTEATK